MSTIGVSGTGFAGRTDLGVGTYRAGASPIAAVLGSSGEAPMLDSPMAAGGMLILGASGLLGRALLDAATGEVVGTHHRRPRPGTVG